MKKTTFAIALMSLAVVFIGSPLGQEKGKAPKQISNPFGLGGSTPLGIKNRKRKTPQLGDTAMHEVGHKGKRRPAPKQFPPNPGGDDTTAHFRTNAKPRTAQYNPKEIGIDKAQNQTPNAAIGEGASDVNARRNKRNARKSRFMESTTKHSGQF